MIIRGCKRFGFTWLMISLLGFCRHAMVVYPPMTPDACITSITSRDCKKALELRNSSQNQAGETHRIVHDYYFFGIYPGARVLDTAKFCPRGPKLVHQYTSFWNGVWEQLSFTIYSPQTLEIECYP
ncbi:Bor/Iss family lipoprotein [Leptospira fainei]|uniref:Bor/Iss family lipoprotein n=1 Tax=Leptospira fainei TaxID=48782 RepID=UPI000688F192|nr:hypothetical protein [Leptospira fainei]